MRCHQILTGACNASTDCFAVGTVFGVPFTVYATGCDLVIMDQLFDRVQILPGVNYDQVQISCVDCSADCGRIAAAYGSRVCVFAPVPHRPQPSHNSPISPLKSRWVLQDTIHAQCAIHNLSWNLDGTHLLTGGEHLEMWVKKAREEDPADSRRVKFALGEDAHEEPGSSHFWECSWRVRTAEPVHFMAFSKDGTLFATAGQDDHIVKVWYEKKQAYSRSSAGGEPAETAYDFIYLAHPLPVTGLQWRHTSKFMHRGAVANMLVTSCRDNICRVWVETQRAADDGLDLSWLSATSLDSMYHPRRHKHHHRVMHKFKHMRQCFQLRRPGGKSHGGGQPPDWQLLDSMTSLAGEEPGGPLSTSQTLHFHLAASISAESDIPLVPSMGTSETGSSMNFMVHWLNNKEMTYTDEMERLLAEIDRLEHQQQQQQQQQQGEEEVSPGGEGIEEGVLSPSPASLSAGSSANTLDGPPCALTEDLESRLAALLKEWEQGSDLLFAIHPVDGSFLVWTIDYLDEHTPSFRQAQVSFSSRIPQAFPLGDAMTMSTKLCLFPVAAPVEPHFPPGEGEPPPPPTPPSPFPCMAMVSKHANGSLNLWTITFSEHSKFKTVLNVAHGRRVCGHRFRVNDITCHPVLPLMLSTSHHNPQPRTSGGSGTDPPQSAGTAQNYTSELILWRVDPIGPLSRTGGVTELTRVNVPEMSAFSHVAWVPTLLPSTTLGPICNSPSTCFVASDGRNLNLYQAVIDARSLLAEINNAERKIKRMGSAMSDSSDSSSVHAQLKTQTSIGDCFRLVSQQSASRPGCVIHLNTIPDVTHDWEHTQFLHVYQEQLIVGRASGARPGAAAGAWYPADPSFSAIVDLHQADTFSEPFYIVVIERDTLGTMIHMWRVVLSSQPLQGDSVPSTSPGDQPSPVLKPVSISTVKVCTQRLPLPEGVEVTCATPAAGHLSSASIYPACFATYHVVTACSDNTVRFWKCHATESRGPDGVVTNTYQWLDWEMMNSTKRESTLQLPGRPLTVSVAYSARVSCAYKIGRSFTRKGHDRSARFVNLGVVIYECESSGGSEWVKEDTIMLHNVPLPCLYTGGGDHGSSLLEAGGQRWTLQGFGHSITEETEDGEPAVAATPQMRTAPSFINDNTVKTAIAEEGNILMSVTHKHLARIDWVSSEDGSHMLTLGVGSKILIFTRVSSDITLANMKAMKENTSRPMLQKASSIALSSFSPDQIRWMKIRQIKLESADGLPPIPMQMRWVRDGVLIVGMDNEMHVYSQWNMPPMSLSLQQRPELQPLTDDYVASRNLTDQQLFTYASDSMKKRIMSVSSLAHLDLLKSRGAAEPARPPQHDYMPSYGLFVASRIAFPVLPQYHPKQLMELLNCGKVKRVKAILAHIVRYVKSLSRQSRMESTATDPELEDPDLIDKLSRSRGMSVSLQPGSPLERQQMEDIRPDYEEIDSVPPLPLWMLLAADRDRRGQTSAGGLGGPQDSENYDDLFKVDDGEATLEDIIGAGASKKRRKSATVENTGLSHFGPRESRLLTQLLTHCHLPDLTSIDQLYLMALADTVASVDADLADHFDDGSDDSAGDHKNTGPSLDSVDDCGLRFVLAMRNFTYLSKCLPPKEKAELNSQGLTSSYVVWGFHSESEEELVQLVPSVARGEAAWRELQQLGAGWWIRSNTRLRRLVEQIAKTAFQRTKDPMDAALYYFAMRKRTVIAALYRQTRDERRYKFFSKDFSTPEGCTAAKKNAYQCLGKQKFVSAAALFLLADSLTDCVEVILTKLKDLQLAMLVCRLYDGERDSCPPSLCRLLNKEILGISESGEADLSGAHPDPFLRSMAYWIKKDYSSSLNTLLKVNVGTQHTEYQEEDAQTYYGTSPTVFNFYVYLRTHPLIVKQYKAQGAQDRRRGRAPDPSDHDKKFFHEDAISPLERQLYFSTAHAHYRAGCPTLALEVLSKLPNKVLDSSPEAESAVASPLKSAPQDKRIDTGMIDWGQPVSSLTSAEDTLSLSAAPDWEPARAPSPLPQALGQDFDWSTPVSARLAPEPLQLSWDDDRGSDSSTDTAADTQTTPGPSAESGTPSRHMDIMAQQLKFIACLQLMMEELSNLATGLGVDGGQLRYQLYLWLERQVEALIDICNYDGGTVTEPWPVPPDEEESGPPAGFPGDRRPTLHDVLLTDKMDFEEKLQRATRRKTWLKANQALLRTLLSYCSLQGAAGGALASVRMELILLLQELQQESSRQQLLSPLPFPTMIPLLSASVANNKTVVMDPVRHLQAMAHDLLHMATQQTSPPSPSAVDEAALAVLKNTAVALSSCVYQALCDSDAFKVKQKDGLVGYSVDGIVTVTSSHLTAGLGARSRRLSTDDQPAVTSTPAKWPGVTSLRALLSREKDEDGPQLTVLLAEVFAAVFTSLLITAIACCDARLLYRLVRLKIDTRFWSAVFGGGVRKLLRVATNVVTPSTPPVSELNSAGDTSLLSSLNKQRAKLNMKLLGQLAPGSPPSSSGGGATPAARDEHPTFREVFVPPETSIVQLILAKPVPDQTTGPRRGSADEDSIFDYDSDKESLHEDDYDYGDEDGLGMDEDVNTEHSDPASFSWKLMRFACMKLCKQKITQLLCVAGIEQQELPVVSPLVHTVLRLMDRWAAELEEVVNASRPPEDYIPNLAVDETARGPPITKYRAMVQAYNTPFDSRLAGVGPVKRLWLVLTRQEAVQDTFIRLLFSRRYPLAASLGSIGPEGEPDLPTDPIKIIHKEQDAVTAFCINQSNPSLMVLATQKEVQELDVALLVSAPNWLESETDYDSLNPARDPDSMPTSSYLVVQMPSEAGGGLPGPGPAGSGYSGPGSAASSLVPSPTYSQTGRGSAMLMRHRVEGVRRLCAHPNMAVYITGAHDGSVTVREWGAENPIAVPRASGTYAKVNRVRFNTQGNKFGVADNDGNLSLWQMSMTAHHGRPFYSLECHSKVCSDFMFVGSSSLLATAGLSADNKNVCLWDTLLPKRKAQVAGFCCHESGASTLLYSHQHQLLISGGKRGSVCIFDVRRRQIRHRFTAHEASIKCMALDPNEEYFVTGSDEGDIKVWGLTVRDAFFSFPAEHARGGFFKNAGHGVTQLHLDDDHRLYSCGADGSMKLRVVPHRDSAVQTAY